MVGLKAVGPPELDEPPPPPPHAVIKIKIKRLETHLDFIFLKNNKKYYDT